MKLIPAALLFALVVATASPSALADAPDYTRTPVLLVHGYFPTGAADWVTWGRFRDKLIDEGWPEEYVYAPQFADTTGCDPDHAREISGWVDELRNATGFDRINIVAHSEGGLNTMYYLRYFCGVNKVANFVGLAIAVHGTRVACVDFVSCGADEMCIPNADNGGWQANPVLAAVNDCDETLGDIRYTSIWSEFDEIIVPQSGSMLRGANNIELDGFVEHGLIFLVDQSFNYLKEALLDGTGLNTDGPGWDCIDYCVPPEASDDALPPETAETAERADDPDVTGDVSDDLPRTDSMAEESVPDADAGDEEGDARPDGDVDVTGPGRDALSPDTEGGDTVTRDAAADAGTDTGAPAGTGGCAASPGKSFPSTIILAAFLFLLIMFKKTGRSTARD